MTHLYGKAFQKAHLALCDRKRKEASRQKRKPFFNKRDVLEAIAVALGILIALYGLCALASNVDGNGWHVGNYRTTPCWND